MFNNLFSKGRQYVGDVPEPKQLELEVKITFRKKNSNYEYETLATADITSTLPIDSDGKVKDVRSAIEQQLAHTLAPIDAVLESDPRLTDGAWKKSQTKEE